MSVQKLKAKGFTFDAERGEQNKKLPRFGSKKKPLLLGHASLPLCTSLRNIVRPRPKQLILTMSYIKISYT